MKRSSGPRKTANLSESVHQYLPRFRVLTKTKDKRRFQLGVGGMESPDSWDKSLSSTLVRMGERLSNCTT
jgi:hypothetical protein